MLRINWNQSYLNDFLSNQRFLLWLPAVYVLILLLLPILPRPKSYPEIEAATPTKVQAWRMLIITWSMDYAIVGIIFYGWNMMIKAAKSESSDGNYFYPFAAACMLQPVLMMLPLKDDFQCRVLFPSFTSRAKLNNWPYSWSFNADIFINFIGFNSLSVLAFSFLGCFDFSLVSSASHLLRIWVESFVEARLIDIFGMLTLHKWMHEHAYFLHKKHHIGKANLSTIEAFRFDLLDLVFEFGGGVPLTCILKYMLGMNPAVHVLSYFLALFAGINSHAANPYAVYYFNIILDYFGRVTVCHNLHHTVQLDYYTGVPHHFLSSKARQDDIARYNRNMKTAFPTEV